MPIENPAQDQPTRAILSLGALRGEHHADGFEQNEDIEEKRGSSRSKDRIEFSAESLDGGAIVITNLRPARHAGFDAMAHGVERNIASQLIDEERAFGPGSNQTISPLRTLNNWGHPSTRSLRMIRPTEVTRERRRWPNAVCRLFPHRYACCGT